MRLEGKVAIITGAGAGMGRAAAQIFAREGAKVVLAEWKQELGEAVAAELGQAGHDALFVKTDVSREEDVASMVERAVTRHGRVDVLFNNAGLGGGTGLKMGSILETPLEDWNGLLAVNLGGAYLCSRHVVPHMMKQRSGSIVHNASMNALVGNPTSDAYTAAKGGVVALTRAMAVRYGAFNVRVNCVCPGPIDTPLLAPKLADPARLQHYQEKTLLGRLGTSEEVANVALFLASDEASYVTGAIVPVDGGWTAV